MKLVLLLLAISTPVIAEIYDDPVLMADPLANPMPSVGVMPSMPIYDRYAPTPQVVAPIPPGQGTSYYSRDQVMTDHQSCYRSAATGAWVCQGH
jgi:hypothetical protein